MTVAPYDTTCTACGKRSYSTRKRAKAAARLHSGERMSAYACPQGGTGWHLGHLPPAVKARGVAARSTLRPRT